MVYMGQSQNLDTELTTKSHHRLLLKVFGSEEDAMQSVLYSYTYSFSGFAAKLNSTQATTLAKMQGVVSVFESRILELHTTRSWDFMGLTLDNGRATPMQLAFGADVIVGILDSGIWPESESFHEEHGMGPIPSSWKGECEEGEDFNPATACNRKLIGARYYLTGIEQQLGPLTADSEYRSPRDRVGHGTHTASTAVGSIVRNANFHGIGQGTARGGGPRARLAVYKVCWNQKGVGFCSEADIMAGFHDALKDGVHMISASIGRAPPLPPFFKSHADIGSFHAMQLGVTVVFSAGNENSAPHPSLVQNVSPWSISVAASSIDRTFPTKIVLDGNLTFMGESLITSQINGILADAGSFFRDRICSRDYYINVNVSASGKVVLCFSNVGLVSSDTAIDAVQNASGLALIFAEPLARQIPDVDAVPTVHVDLQQGTRIRNYLGLAGRRPVSIQIIPGKGVIGKSPAPAVAYFSCRGPSSLSPDILKPDITAPGVNILAAWPSNYSSKMWNFLSGTSMSCPHVAGVAALIKSIHPDWSPAAIRSALMTTAYMEDTASEVILAGGSTKASDPFDVGAGHLNPIKAMDPGLVYDMKTRDYIIFLCNMGYTQNQISLMVRPGTDTTCPHYFTSTSNLNYPAITVSNLQTTTAVKRTVRNVGRNRNTLYYPKIIKPNGVDVYIWPKVLAFEWFKDEITYYVTLKPRKISQGRYDFGEIVWSDRYHNVRIPLAVCVNITDGVITGSTVSHSDAGLQS
ncbi:subtilisin-like protease SBT3.18 isoform X2 [Punica granatum]|nr:subtilisin-like protease SBT3.18 isoform X2 [Punica granatum]XP_031385870.1 subtilisin-like protease SBT3.18 isoform X2 [Punica granatum]XP_031385871.1 subtilisin-like protease SBT3.18 isoform X2 [Punica granatum]XP_031385872.1 subtilisin-like protease SBT3.18 isoform X2 [Punica granatum]XP_031385874.1 subtilisin-like protease SBT3.18 isoform X2 [Punica granatum]XP_031385875.1 subtilisin-like protease SBT3.18 isoform X2 [Punica granatum]